MLVRSCCPDLPTPGNYTHGSQKDTNRRSIGIS